MSLWLFRSQAFLLFRRRAFLQRLRPTFKRWLQRLEETRPQGVLLLVPGLQLFLSVLSNSRLELCLLQRVFEREMVVLRDEREHQRHDVTLERKPRHDALVKRFFGRKQDIDGDFKPRTFRALPRVIQAGEFGRPEIVLGYAGR